MCALEERRQIHHNMFQDNMFQAQPVLNVNMDVGWPGSKENYR
jgi:hypothetical protein